MLVRHNTAHSPVKEAAGCRLGFESNPLPLCPVICLVGWRFLGPKCANTRDGDPPCLPPPTATASRACLYQAGSSECQHWRKPRSAMLTSELVGVPPLSLCLPLSLSLCLSLSLSLSLSPSPSLSLSLSLSLCLSLPLSLSLSLFVSLSLSLSLSVCLSLSFYLCVCVCQSINSNHAQHACTHTHTHTLSDSEGNKNQQITNVDTSAPGGTVGTSLQHPHQRSKKCWPSDEQATDSRGAVSRNHRHTFTHTQESSRNRQQHCR